MQSLVNQTDEKAGSLRLTLITDDGSPLNEKVEIRLNNRDTTDSRVVQAVLHTAIFSQLALYLMPGMALSCSRTRIGDLDSTTPEPSRTV